MTSVRRDPTVLHAVAVAGPFALAALLGTVRGVVGPAPAALALVLVVVAVASVGVRLSGVLAALSAAVGFDVFLTAPYLSLAISDPADVELSVALVVVGLAVSEIALRGRRARAESARREGYVSGLSALLDLPEGPSGEDRGRALAAAVGEVLGAERTAWVAGPPDPRDAVVLPDGSVVLGGAPLDVARSGLPAEAVTGVPVVRDGRAVAHVRVTTASRVTRPSREQLRTAALLVRVAAPTVEGRDDAAVHPWGR